MFSKEVTMDWTAFPTLFLPRKYSDSIPRGSLEAKLSAYSIVRIYVTDLISKPGVDCGGQEEGEGEIFHDC